MQLLSVMIGAEQLAEKHPEIIDKLVIMNTVHPHFLLKAFLNSSSQLKKSWYIFFFQLPKLPAYYISNDLYAFFTKAFREWSHRKDAFTEEDIATYVEAFSKPYALTAAINYYRAAFRETSRQLFAKPRQIHADTMAIWGKDDRALDQTLLKRMTNNFANRLEVHSIPDCSHWVQQERPEEVNKSIFDFLNVSQTNS